MGQQLRARAKRARRKSYWKRKSDAAKTAAKARKPAAKAQPKPA